jgi:hypothetical protein
MSLLTAPDEAIPLLQMFSLSGKVCLITGGNRYVFFSQVLEARDGTHVNISSAFTSVDFFRIRPLTPLAEVLGLPLPKATQKLGLPP